MRSNRLLQICTVVGALILIIVLYLAPRTPAPSVSNDISDIDRQVEEAVHSIQTSPNPMQGILTLREIANEHPEHMGAQWHLAVFSLQTGQFEKAKQRLLTVIELDTESAFPEAYMLLGGVYGAQAKYDSALINMDIALELVQDDTAATREVKMLIETMKAKRDSINLN